MGRPGFGTAPPCGFSQAERQIKHNAATDKLFKRRLLCFRKMGALLVAAVTRLAAIQRGGAGDAGAATVHRAGGGGAEQRWLEQLFVKTISALLEPL